MKKIYVSILLNVVTFNETDVIRTSGAKVADGFTETGVDFDSYFGEGN